MPPKTLTAEQVAEIDRQQKPAVNMRNIVPQRKDVLAARITAQQRREAAPATLTPEQADATEAQTSVSAMTPFGRAMGAEPDKTAGPVFQPKKRLSATEVDQMQYEQISDPAYMPTKDEFQWYEGYKKTRNDKVSKFVQGAKGMAGGLVQAAAATAYAPFDLIVRGTNAYDEWVNSSAEGLRQTSIGLAELWSWGGDIYEDNQKELQRSRDLNNQIRQQLAAENKFTGNAQQDEQTLQQAIEQAKAGGMYEKTADDQNADEDARYERFIRDRSFQQQATNITETNIGTMPDSQREMGIDPSKVNPGLAFTAQLVFDPLNAVVPGGIGALSNLRLMRRAAALTGTPLKGLSKVAKAGADKVEDIYGGILSGIESRTGLNEAAVMGALNNPVTWRAVAAMGILKGTGKVLRKSENWLETGSIIAKEAGVGGVGLSRADAAAKLRNAPIPGRYRRAYDGFFTSADSTLRRVSETPGLSPIARRSAATLDRTGVTQAFRLADDAVSGAAAAAPIGIPFAAIAPEDRQPEILGAILSIGAAGGVVGGQVRRMSEMNDALVAKMLADAEISGGDAVAMANMLSPEMLSDMARKQTMISAKADWVPLRAVDYELDKTVKAAVGNGTKGIHVEAAAGKRPRVFLNLDKLASGDVAGHEIGHAIFMSDIMGGEIKQGMRAMVDVEYGAEGLAARGREYAAAMLTQEVNQGATGIKLEVLTPEEVNRKAAGVSEADLIRDRWSNDSAWRESAINDRIDLMDQERMARGGQQLDWARDEIAAETFSGLGKGVNLSGLRASGPLGRAVGAAQTALDMMGARFRGNGRLESPNRLFTENPLFDSPQMRKAVNDYVKIYDRYLVGLEKEGKVKQRGTPIAPTGRSSDAARSPHTRLYPNKGVVESDLFVQRPDGTLELKSQQMVNTQDKARAATLKSINLRDRLVPENSQEWGARRLSNGRVVVGGPTLPPQFDFFLQMPEWLRFKAREFEAGRNEGRSYLYSYNAIGTGADGSYKVKNLGNVEAKTGEAVPFGWDLSQKNHLLAKVIDLNSFRASSMRAIDNQLLGEFGNDLKAVEAGLKQLLKNYQDGVPGETNLGVTKKNILNGLLGTGTPTQRANNPAWHTLNNQGSIRTFRFDRLNYADPYGTGYFPHYDKLNINALPDNAGRMSLDEYMVFDADRQTAWLNNRARERGHSNSTNWANSDEAGFAAASEEYRKLFPRPDNNNRMPQQIPRGAQGMPDVGYGERADIPLNERARRAAFVGSDGRVVSTNKRTHFETNEDLGPDFLAIGAGSISEDGFFRFGSDTMDNPMGETPSESRAAAARHNREAYDSGRRPSELLEDPPGLERGGARRGQAMPDAETRSAAVETLDQLKRSQFIPTKVAAEVVGGFPEYLRPVAQFITDQRQKLANGQMTRRDVMKAYAMTIASQGSGARAVEVIANNVAKDGVRFRPSKDFTTADKKGRAAIRPEEAAAYWLGTDAGQKALDNFEAGRFSPDDWKELVAIRKAYGDDRFNNLGAFNPDNIRTMDKVLADLNASRADTGKVMDAVQQLRGIKTGKKGFIAHLLGIGDVPTIDAVEINFWLTGKADIGKLNTRKATLARSVKESISDRRVSQEMFRRIDQRINALRDEVPGGASISQEVWSHVMHHWLWDKSKGIETTHEGMYRAQAQFMPDVAVNDEGGTVWRTLQDAPVITLKDLKGRKVFAAFADLTSAGKIYRGIDSSEIAVPVETHGGPEWPLLQAEKVGEETNVWSNQGAGVSAIKARRANEGAIMLVAAMDKNAHVSNTETATAVIATNAAYARDGRITPENLATLDNSIRREIEDFPGIESPSIMEYVNKLPFQGAKSRARIAEILESKKSQDLGAPNVQRILDEVRSDQYDGLRIGDAVLAIELTPGATAVKLGEQGTLKHPSYQYGLRGRVIGRFARPININSIFDDFYAQRRADGKPELGDRRAFDLAKPVQEITDAIASRIPGTPYRSFRSPRHAQLINIAKNDSWKSSEQTVKAGGVSPAAFIDALNASPAKLALDRYTLKGLQEKLEAGDMSIYQLADAQVFFGIKQGDPASAYGQDPAAFGFGPNEKTLSLVLNNERKTGGMADAIVMKSLQLGVTALDCFAVKSKKYPEGVLPTLYEAYGFESAGSLPFDPQFYSKTELADLKKYWKSTGWDEGLGLPEIVLMKWKGNNELRTKSLRELAEQGGQSFRGETKPIVRDTRSRSKSASNKRNQPKRRAGQGDAGSGAGSQGDAGRGVRLSRGFLGAYDELLSMSPDELRNLGIK